MSGKGLEKRGGGYGRKDVVAKGKGADGGLEAPAKGLGWDTAEDLALLVETVRRFDKSGEGPQATLCRPLVRATLASLPSPVRARQRERKRWAAEWQALIARAEKAEEQRASRQSPLGNMPSPLRQSQRTTGQSGRARTPEAPAGLAVREQGTGRHVAPMSLLTFYTAWESESSLAAPQPTPQSRYALRATP